MDYRANAKPPWSVSKRRRPRSRSFTLLRVAFMCSVVAACSDDPLTPTGPQGNSRSVQAMTGLSKDRFRTFDDELHEIALQVPGFAGLYLDNEGALVILGAGVSDTASMVNAVRSIASSSGLALMFPSQTQSPVFHSVSHDFRSLVEWKRLLREYAWTSGIVFVDIDEVGNVLRVGVENAVVQQSLRGHLLSLGVPAGGLVVSISGRAVPEAELTDKFRPIPAGVLSESALGQGCTVGFNAATDLGLGYVLSSHCGWRFGNLQDGTFFRQNTGASNTVGFEAADPELDPCTQAAAGCRYSDAAFIAYDSASLGQKGLIARTLGLGSKTINPSHPRFTINAPSYAFLLVGAIVNKMGKTTGWTQGTVLSTCIDVEWTVPSEGTLLDTYLLCQFGANYGSDGGDSGAPIFSWNGSASSVDLRGLHNGRRFLGSSERIFSAWRFIDLELNQYVGFLDIAY